MKRIAAPLALAAAIFVTASASDEAPKSGEKSGADAASAYMEAWQRAGQPGENHALLARFEGVWHGEVTAFGPPGSGPMTGKTTGTQKMELGGRYLVTHFDGDFMGQPFNGVWTAGYSNVHKTFQADWIDNTRTSIEKFTGTYDPAAETFTWTADLTNPVTGGANPVRETMKWTGKDSYLQEFFQIGPDGKAVKMQQIEFTRAEPLNPAGSP
ncbi:DUF1579 family protein [Candidatus Poribacteria bacterium]|nr:DUF1579 family protein [Candidatus Poribacteria bacterium]